MEIFSRAGAKGEEAFSQLYHHNTLLLWCDRGRKD
jgi:hypothetical protein